VPCGLREVLPWKSPGQERKLDVENNHSKMCYISVGGNIHPEETIPRALSMLHKNYAIEGVSTFYRTAPINRPGQPEYLNGAVAIRYDGHPSDLKYNVLYPIEEALGRKRTKDAYAPRPIDLDIVLCGNLVLKDKGLVLPDPDIRERVFLVASLLELNEELVLPDSNIPLTAFITEKDRQALIPDRPFTRALRERFTP